MPYSNPTETIRKVYINNYRSNEVVEPQPHNSDKTRISA
jgi:hypothetical protein